jgi:predicted phage baseplate assembly protein
MSELHDPNLDACECCEEARDVAPAPPTNPPGQAALKYRIATHHRFKAAMEAGLSRLSAETMNQSPEAQPLTALTTRDDDDASIAVVDGWASVLDVLAFYQERIANEAYLRTATELASVVDLANEIGYIPKPGVAASTQLAFQLETAPTAPTSVSIPIGTQVQSLPGPGEVPQTFETVEAIEARPEWNSLIPRLTQTVAPTYGDTSLYLDGTDTGLSAGDAILLVGSQRHKHPTSLRWEFRILSIVEPDTVRGVTRVTWIRPLGHRGRTRARRPSHHDVQVFGLSKRVNIFGYNAPDYRTMPDKVKENFGGSDTAPQWPNFTIYAPAADKKAPKETIDLDPAVPGLSADGWIVLARGNYVQLFSVTKAAHASRADFAITAQVTRVVLHGFGLNRFAEKVRTTIAWIAGAPLKLAEWPITDPVQGDQVILRDGFKVPERGRLVVFTGRDAGGGAPVAEAATLVDADYSDPAHTRLRLAAPLTQTYSRTSVAIAANVAAATHGETKREVLGSGDGSRGFQSFQLKQSPLTYVSGATAAGATSTLQVRANDTLWQEAPSFFGLDGRRRDYIVRSDNEGIVSLRFGDGTTGARLPSGRENVAATYRVGTGLAGLVKAGQLSLLLTRPLGTRSVTNPLAPTGAADPETLDDARTNAPLGVLTMGRVVSLTDYEDFCRAFAGIAKAQARWVWSGESRIVHVTVAGPAGAAIDPSSKLYKNLVAAIRDAGDPHQRFRLDSYESVTFQVAAILIARPDKDPDKVKAAVAAALLDSFSFGKRNLGQAVAASEVIAVIQATEGVVAVDLTTGPDPILFALGARWDKGQLLPAQLLTIDPATTLTVAAGQ